MRSIIVGTDFSEESLAALDIAVDMSNRTGLGIKLIWVKKNRILAGSEQTDVVAERARLRLAELCSQCQTRLTRSSMEWRILEGGRVAEQFKNYALEIKSPMIIIGTNGASGFEKYLMGSTAVRIIQEAPCPVLTIRKGYDPSQGMKDIVVPIRILPNSRQKVPHAVAAAKRTGARLHVLGLLDAEQDRPSLSTYLKQVEDRLTQEGVQFVTVLQRYDDYPEDVMRYAEKVNAQMIVISTEQNRPLSKIFLGTNAQQIVHRSQTPVLCIHPEDLGTISR